MRASSKRVLVISVAAFMAFGLSVWMVRPEVARAYVVYSVNSTADVSDANPGDLICETATPGECTLRAAIEEANANSNPSQQDVINFNLTGPADFTNGGQDGYTIAIGSSLPEITENLQINGYSQAGSQKNTTPLIHQSNGVQQPLDSRLLVQITSSGPTILQAAAEGVVIEGLVLGGATNAGSAGIQVNSGSAIIRGNYIGTDPTGMTAQANFAGVTLSGGPGSTVGGTNDWQTVNLISGNTGAGIVMYGTSGNTVNGNVIGPDREFATDTALTPGVGIGVSGPGTTSGNMIGQAYAEVANVIAGNAGAGVLVMQSPATTVETTAVLSNSIYDNGGQGIDLVADSNGDFVPDTELGPNPNDSGDVDSGANDYVNTVDIHSVTRVSDRLYVHFDLDATGSPTNEYRVEWFANPTNTSGEGRIYLGCSCQASAGSDQVINFYPQNSFDTSGMYLTATVTQLDTQNTTFPSGYGATSEFSEPAEIQEGVYDIDVIKDFAPGQEVRPGGTLTYRFTFTNNGDVPFVPEGLESNSPAPGIYDMYSPALEWRGGIESDNGTCLPPENLASEDFFRLYAPNHQGYGLIVCVLKESRDIMMPGDTFTIDITFTVGNDLSGGISNYALSESQDDQDILGIYAVTEAIQNGSGQDLLDEIDTGALRLNGDVTVHHWRATSESGQLAKSGVPVLWTSVALLGLVVASTAALRHRRVAFHHR